MVLKTVLSYRTILLDRFSRLFWTLCSEGHDLGNVVWWDLSWILRRSKLEAPQTFIDIDCTFGGVEIYLPSDWNLLTQIDAFIGGCDDKRYNSSVEIDKEHILIVRGKVSFGGIEFKS